jgi:hypothetical protein
LRPSIGEHPVELFTIFRSRRPFEPAPATEVDGMKVQVVGIVEIQLIVFIQRKPSND